MVGLIFTGEAVCKVCYVLNHLWVFFLQDLWTPDELIPENLKQKYR